MLEKSEGLGGEDFIALQRRVRVQLSLCSPDQMLTIADQVHEAIRARRGQLKADIVEIAGDDFDDVVGV